MKPSPIKPAVPLSALEALDIRVGTIEAVENVPDSRKLVRLIVNFAVARKLHLSERQVTGTG